MTVERTIAAIATPQGTGAIGIIRLSGPQAVEITNSIFEGKDLNQLASHQAQYGHLKDGEKLLDEVIITIFRGPKSFTTEDVVEIGCHASPYILRRTLELLVDNGAKMASPGEFSQRAFLNGRIDLSQAEAISDLIAANSKASQQLAMNQMRKGYSSEIELLRQQLIEFTALIELELDFSEEDVEFADRTQLVELLSTIEQTIQPLNESFKLGNAIKEGVNTVIAGRPNAGKSTLLNALLNEERAIVSDIEGTTRDSIEAQLAINGVQFRLIDTAGLRDAQDKIEAIGVDRALDKIKQSSILVYVFDVVDMKPEELWDDLQKLNLEDQQLLVVANKMDLNPYTKQEQFFKEGLLASSNMISASAINKMNIEFLKESIYNCVAGGLAEDQVIISNLRHYEALQTAQTAISKIKEGLERGLSGELLSIDIKEALRELGNITGAIDVDQDILGTIFGRFCIGK